jgi:hypothetical protein
MGSYVFSAARKKAFRAAQEKAWAMRRGTKSAVKSATKSAAKSTKKKLNIRTASDEKLLFNLKSKIAKAREANLVGDWDKEKRFQKVVDDISNELRRRSAIAESKKINRTGLFARSMYPGMPRY